LAAGRANFERHRYQGEFIQAFVGNGHFSIDGFFRKRSLSHLDILHSDIQGFETEMLVDAFETLSAQKIDYIFISTHSQDGHDLVLSSLRDYAYRIEVSSDFEHDTTSYDGLVFASSQNVQPLFSNFTAFGREDIVNSSASKFVEVVNARIP
jgi:hypothetical protein